MENLLNPDLVHFFEDIVRQCNDPFTACYLCYLTYGDNYISTLNDLLESPKIYLRYMQALDVPNKKRVLREAKDMYSVLDVFLDKNRVGLHKFYANCVKQFSDKDMSFLDVACGEMPLSTMFLGEYFNHPVEGVDVVEQFLSDDTLAKFNAHVERASFTPMSNVSGFDIIGGIGPCDVTEDVVFSARNHNKPLFIRLCECNSMKTWKNQLTDIDPSIKMLEKFAYARLDATDSQLKRIFENATHETDSFIDITFNQQKAKETNIIKRIFSNIAFYLFKNRNEKTDEKDVGPKSGD